MNLPVGARAPRVRPLVRLSPSSIARVVPGDLEVHARTGLERLDIACPSFFVLFCLFSFIRWFPSVRDLRHAFLLFDDIVPLEGARYVPRILLITGMLPKLTLAFVLTRQSVAALFRYGVACPHRWECEREDESKSV